MEPPERSDVTKSKNRRRTYRGRKVDYAKLESENRGLGDLGEKYIVAIEKDRLTKAGRPDLAERVMQVSVELDGLGHDVRSFELDESERCIEVKTTKHGKEFPFLISENEVQFSIDHCNKYFLYRVFNFGKSTKFFVLTGSLAEHCTLSPQIYQATF